MSLLGRKRSQEALEFLREESGWGSALGLLPELEVLEDLSNHAALFDHRDDFKRVGNREYIVHEKTGLITSADPDDVSRAITRLFSDDNLRLALGRTGRESVRIYDWDNVIEQFLIPVYQQMDE